MARSRALPRPQTPSLGAAVRYLPALPVAAGAVLLIVAEFLTLREIRTVTVVPPGGTTSAGAHHSYALALLGIAMLPMGFGAVVRGARPAAVALLVLSLIAAWIVVGVDRPVLDDTGLIGRTYDLAEAHAGTGFAVEALGTALAVVGAVGALALSSAARRSRGPGERQRRH